MRVCIIGSGLSAMTLAKALVNEKIHVDLYEQKKLNVLNMSRTLGISTSNINFFNDKIINIKNLIWNLKKIEIYSENLKNQKLLNFENTHGQLFSIVKNYKLYEILEKKLNKNKFYKKKKSKVNLNLSTKYNLIINTDYFSCFTKKYLNKKIVKNYSSFAHTAIIKHEKLVNNVAIQIFTKNGPLAFLPVSNNETSIVYSVHGQKKYKERTLVELIKNYNLKYKIQKISNFEIFELNSLSLRSYYHNNILAFGDMLHRIHPLAGQGFNMTIRDIKILLDIIINKKILGLPLDSSVNKEFEKISKHKNFIFSNGIDFVHEFFNFERKVKSKFLSKSVKIIGNNPSINKIFTKIADEGVLT